MPRDERGLEFSAESAEAVALFDETLRCNLEYRKGTAKAMKAVVEAEPGFVMGRVLQGYLFMLFGSVAFDAKVAEARAAAEAGVDRVTARERAHVSALGAWAAGDLKRAERLWDGILVDHPLDLLALRLQHFANFYLGRARDLRDHVARVLPLWGSDVPGHGFLHGMYAFGLEECADYAAAEREGEAAAHLNPDDLWAIHAVAHVLEMQGRLKEGLSWLSHPLELWDDRNAFKAHIWWHRALFHWEGGDYEAVLDLYDRAVRQDRESDFYLDLVNAAALLWRLAFQGISVGDRWEELADTCETRIGDGSLAFSDVHFLMALAGAGRQEAAEREIAALGDYAGRPDNTSAATMEPVAIPLCRGILAFARGDYAGAAERILAVRHDTACLGGSHAQRDVFDLFLIEAALRGGDLKLARALLAERTAAKPHSLASWRKYAQVLAELGDLHAAAEASRHFDEELMM